MGEIIEKATVREIEHDGDPNVKALVVSGDKLSELERGDIWNEICNEGWEVMNGPGRDIIIYRRS